MTGLPDVNDEIDIDTDTDTDTEADAGTGAAASTVPADGGGRGWRLQRNDALDGLRAVAVMLVIGVHAWNAELPGGGIGVSMFFTLSGFLITALLLAELVDEGRLGFLNFYMRRVLRLVPALVVFVGVVYLYSRITGLDEERVRDGVFPALFYYANWARVAGAKLGMLGHTWSLAVEEQFYLVWPVILFIAYRLGRVWGVLVAAVLGTLASLTVRLVLTANPTSTTGARVQNGFDTQSAAIFVGCVFAALLILGWKPRWWVLTPVAVWFVWYLSGLVSNIYKAGDASRGVMPVVFSIGFAAVICLLVWWPASIPARILGFAPIAYVGRISYGMYLWHFPITYAVEEQGYDNSAMALALVTAITIPVATVSYFAVERPFLRLKDRFRSIPQP